MSYAHPWAPIPILPSPSTVIARCPTLKMLTLDYDILVIETCILCESAHRLNIKGAEPYCPHCGRILWEYGKKRRDYYLTRVCWSCDDKQVEARDDWCGKCGNPWDGSEQIIWTVRGKRGMGPGEEVDMDEELREWRRWKRKIEEKYLLCAACGKVCEGKRGLKQHGRYCSREAEELRGVSKVGKRKVRDCIEMD